MNKKYRILWYQTTFFESYVEAIDEEQARSKADNNLDTELIEIESDDNGMLIAELEEVDEIPEVETGISEE